MQQKTIMGVVFCLMLSGFIGYAFSLPQGNIVHAAGTTFRQVSSAVTVLASGQPANTPKDNDAQKTPPQKNAANTEANTDRIQVAPETNSAQSQAGIPAPVALAARPGRIGIFTTDSPIDPSSLARLDQLHGLGVDTIYNYTVLDGNEAQIRTYLDRAAANNIQIIISLKDLYDQLGASNYRDLYSYPLGNSNEEAALNAVRLFANHPAVWGFGISDEAPESPAELGQWQPILQGRYQKIKSLTSKPVMEVLVGATSSSAGARRSFLSSLRSSTDTFALDYYPIPYQSQALISDIGGDLRAVGDNNGWFVTQAFSWSSYPGTAANLGFSLASARLPTSYEMVAMSALALNGGARNILFYSYFDIKNNPAQLSALRQAITSLRN